MTNPFCDPHLRENKEEKAAKEIRAALMSGTEGGHGGGDTGWAGSTHPMYEPLQNTFYENRDFSRLKLFENKNPTHNANLLFYVIKNMNQHYLANSEDFV